MPSPPSSSPERWLRHALLASLLLASSNAAGCRFDRSERWLDVVEEGGCESGTTRCGRGLQRCVDRRWQTVDDCGARGLQCSVTLAACVECQPSTIDCRMGDVVACHEDGQRFDVVKTCDRAKGLLCSSGACRNLCDEAQARQSNVGCEYWAVDLDNAALGASNNAAAQQFAVVVSNPQRDVPVQVTISQDDGTPGGPAVESIVATGPVTAGGLRVFKLGPREVDGSPEGEFNTGTGTALGRRAYRLTTNFPVVAYQFNPLENANVFSNDASLLKPVSALGTSDGSTLLPTYSVVSWPQTIASSDDPNTDFGGTQLRAFLTLVGTRAATKVRIRTSTRVIAGGPVVETPAGGVIEATLDPFDVLNLETSDFNGDFTGSVIEASGPLAVFTGSEASDAPTFSTIAKRFCCADHLEEQLDPIRTAGVHFVAPHGPSRTRAVAAAGAELAVVPEPDYFRVVAASDSPTVVTTTLPAPDDTFTLEGRGKFRQIEAYRDFQLDASAPVALGHVSPSQEAAGIRRGLPGGDPSLLIVPPIEQWRSDYVFLTPDKYAFDFVTLIAPTGTSVLLDGAPIGEAGCEVAPADGLSEQERKGEAAFTVYRCQLSFPRIDPTLKAPNNVLLGEQNDGVHRVSATRPVAVLVSGFDSFVSYSYAGGTQLEDLGLQ